MPKTAKNEHIINNCHSFFSKMEFPLSDQYIHRFDWKNHPLLFVENRLEKFFNKELPSYNHFFQKNYIETQIKAFFWGLDTLPAKINFSWLHYLHKLAVQDLVHEAGGPILNELRESSSHPLSIKNPIACKIAGHPKKSSILGLNTLVKQFKDIGQDIIWIESDYVNLKEKRSSLKEVVDIQWQQDVLIKKNKEQIREILKEFNIKPAHFFASSHEFLTIEDEILKSSQILTNKYPLLSKCFGYYFPYRNTFKIRQQAEIYINAYNDRATALEPSQQIKAIISLVKKLLNLHLWEDGNGRICAHLLLNLLLIQNRLPPTLLDNNCLDAFTIEELYHRIVLGMKKFLSLCNNSTSNLEQFRSLHYPRYVISSMARAILSDNMEAIANCKSFTKVEMFFFIAHPKADIKHLHAALNQSEIVVDKRLYHPNDFLAKLLSQALEHANEHFIRSILTYADEKKLIQLIKDYLGLFYSHGTIEIYRQLQRAFAHYLPIDLKLIFTSIPYCTDENVARALIQELFNHEAEIRKIVKNDEINNYQSYYYDLCKLQTAEIILSYFLLADFTKFQCDNKFVQIINQRIDLSELDKRNLNSYLEPYTATPSPVH